MWEHTATIYETDGLEQNIERVTAKEFNTFDKVEQEIFSSKLDITGKNIIQIGCNDGTELINLKKKGAHYCLGVDISENFIKHAKTLSKVSRYKVDFICTSIYDIDKNHFGKFDLIYITVGVLGWMPNLLHLFNVASKLLVREGQVFIYEQHPILGMFNPEPPHIIDSSYFKEKPFKDEKLPEYIDKSGLGKATSYWFPYKTADILMACVNNGIQITHFDEHEHEISDTYKILENRESSFPLSFTLIGRKT